MSKNNFYRIKMRLFDIEIEVSCNHKKLYSILQSLILFSHPSSRKNPQIKIQINVVKKINWLSYPINKKMPATFDSPLLKYFYHNNCRYYTDFINYLTTHYSDSKIIRSEVCERILKFPLLIQYVTTPLINTLKNDIFLLHAAALEKDKTGYLFPGPSHSGKTTLSLALIKEGYRFLSDDTVFIKSATDSLEASMFLSRDLTIREKTGFISRILSETKENYRLKPSSDKKSVLLELAGIWQEQRVNRINLHKIIFPKITKQAKTKLLAIDQKQAFLLLMKNEELFAAGDAILIKKNLNFFKRISSLKERYILFLGRDALASSEIIPRILDTLKKESG